MAEQESAESIRPKMQVMLAASHSIKGYPKPSLSSRNALDWILTSFSDHAAKRSTKSLSSMSKSQMRMVCYEDMDSMYTTVNDIRSHRKMEKQKGLALLEYFVKRCNEAEVDCEAWLSKGDPKLVICKEAKERQPDLLVLGSRGLGTLQRMFVGGLSSYCAKNAPCPVVIIRRDPSKTPSDPLDD